MIPMIPALVLFALGACDPTPEPLSRAELLDPSQCVDCHPAHVAQWRNSTHANAARDPVFQAMNQRYLRETGDTDPTLCVGCHAPLAVQTGALADPTAIDALPEGLSGVGCMWCHQVDAVTGTHNAALTVAEDVTLRGGIADPIQTWAHESAWSPLLDRDAPEASSTCGACHDVVLPNGVHLERTYAEWQDSVFDTTGPARLGCGHCHMPGSTAKVVPDGPARTVHDHTMPGISVLDDPAHAAAVQQALDGSVQTSICVAPASAGSEIAVVLENVGAGHGFPSGAAKHRRVWVELVATAAGQELLRTGTFDDDEAVVDGGGLATLHEQAWDAFGEPAAMMWEVAEVESHALPPPETLDPRDPAFDHTRRFTWRISGATPDTVTARVLVRPMGLDVLEELVQSGDLDPRLAASPTLQVAASVVTWQGVPGDCTD